MTPHGLYCYKVMLFGLKNAGATYQRLMTKIFKSLIGRTVEIYIDDIVVKIKTWSEHAMHLEETFRLMRAYNMKLNLAKCFFGVSMGKFLGFMVMQRGIEVNPNQIRAILETHVHGSKKELQHLTGRLAALGYFIARFTNKLRPLFFTLKEVNKTNWTDDCKRAFDEVKHYLT
ncbi:Retrovirus-related Pol polyprotein from transposon 17.6 [Vitis vinifera]|uniref:Retrovirus-related Pol polyprotein from transposon 17.6 n=1 Tax=Vitis vinifera TaxID=29760 RepID=A0A438CRP8_VITVI|nr:Retrovirus-related Pol polyprotein from transposon 17.6 [Vitis vinifera]